MSTIWGGVCLDHNPLIEFEMHDGSYEIKSHERAFQHFRGSGGEASGHAHCDVVLVGYSYPPVAFSCPCSKHPDHKPPYWDATELRLVLDVARSLDTMTGSIALDEWLRHNRCWTVERLEKIAPIFHPKPEASRPGRGNALREAVQRAGWTIARFLFRG